MQARSVKPLAFTVEQALEIVPISRTRLYAAIGSGELQTFKDGRRRLISARALDEFVAALESGRAPNERELTKATLARLRSACRSRSD